MRYSFYFSILVLGLLCLQSCQKDLFVPPGSKNNPDILARAQAWVENNSPKEASLRSNLSTLDYQWDHYALSKNSKGDDVLTVPITSAPGKKEYLELAFVVAQAGEVGVIKQYEGDLEKWEHVILNMYNAEGRRFISGVYSTKTKLLTVTSTLTSKFSKLEKIASTSASGNSSSEDDWGGGHDPSNPIVIPEVPVPPPGGGGTNPPSGGGGGVTVPVNPGGGDNSPPITLPKLKIAPSKDACAGRAAVNERLNLADIKVKNTEMYNKSTKDAAGNLLPNNQRYEYGYETTMNWSTKEITTNVIRTSGLTHEFDYSMSWDNSKGTVGFNHTHPFQSSPSVMDAFMGSTGYTTTGPTAMTATQKTLFLQYFTSTVVTMDHIYVITIKDPVAWEALIGNAASLEAQFEDLNVSFLELYPGVSVHERQEKAFLEIIGNAVNLYRSDKKAPMDFKPLKLNDNQMSEINPCNN